MINQIKEYFYLCEMMDFVGMATVIGASIMVVITYLHCRKKMASKNNL